MSTVTRTRARMQDVDNHPNILPQVSTSSRPSANPEPAAELDTDPDPSYERQCCVCHVIIHGPRTGYQPGVKLDIAYDGRNMSHSYCMPHLRPLWEVTVRTHPGAPSWEEFLASLPAWANHDNSSQKDSTQRASEGSTQP